MKEAFVSSFVGGGSRFVGAGGASRSLSRGRPRHVVTAKTTVFPARQAPQLEEILKPTLPVFDIDGKRRALVEVITELPKASTLSKLQESGATEGARLIAVGSGTAKQGAEFLKDTGFSGEVFSDPERQTYQALNFTKGVLSTFNLPALSKLMGSFAQGNVQKFEVIPTDPFQQGGCLVVDDTGKVLLQHRDEFAGDHVPDETLLQVLQKTTV